MNATETVCHPDQQPRLRGSGDERNKMKHQSKITKARWAIPALLLALTVATAQAASRTSANYSITTETIHSAGVNAQSANYALHGSAVGEFGVASAASSTSTDYVLKNGYVGQLYDVLAPTSVVSRKMHGSISPPFDITLPLTGPAIGIECRSGG